MVEEEDDVDESETIKAVIGDVPVAENEGIGSEQPCVVGHSEGSEGTSPENGSSGTTINAKNE